MPFFIIDFKETFKSLCLHVMSRRYAAAGRSQAKVEAVLADLKITEKVQVGQVLTS